MTDASNRTIAVDGYHGHVLCDAEPRSNADDHNRYAVWLGEPVGLKLTTMTRADRTEQFPTI
jgi:aromatic ring-cleaving dioxygenase